MTVVVEDCVKNKGFVEANPTNGFSDCGVLANSASKRPLKYYLNITNKNTV